jgi:hypothetical protein
MRVASPFDHHLTHLSEIPTRVTVICDFWICQRCKEQPGPEDLVSKSSYFLADPPPDPRFLASLGTLSLVELDHCPVVGSINRFDRSE